MRVLLLVLQGAWIVILTLVGPFQWVWRKLFGDHRLKP